MGCIRIQSQKTINWVATEICQAQLARDTRIVIDKCINRDGKNAPAMSIQACTELLDRNLLEGHDRFYPFVDRAMAYYAQGDKPHALDDYNTAVKLAPEKSAALLLPRGFLRGAN